MKIVADFGFVTGGHQACMFMAQASLASMRHYCPDVPIALLIDGDFDVSHLVKQYGVIPLRVDDVPSLQMREILGRSYHAKMVPMWEGPFTHYVWIDADAIVWGDFTSFLRHDVDFHIFRSEKDEVVPIGSDKVPHWLPHFFFDPNKLKNLDSGFRWQGNKYFCPGVFAAKRNSIPFEEYLKVWAWERDNPGTFSWGEMGMLNYLVYSLHQRGLLKIAVSDLQDMWASNGKEGLVADCESAGWRFPKTVMRPRVAHFCGRKPFLYDLKSYSRPFTIARLEHYRNVYGEGFLGSLRSWMKILAEEWQVLKPRLFRKLGMK
jgi:hypothetical protein